jgi:archaellum component FlaC
MTEQREDELRIILQEGAAAIREMRRGLENACAGLQDFYGKALSREADKPKVLNPLKVSASGKN